MKALRFVVPGLFALLLTGCRSGGNAELLERELRLQEDRIYQLESCLCDYEATIEAGRRENESLKEQLFGANRGFAPEPIAKPSRGAPRGGRPSAPLATPLAPPEINLGPGGPGGTSPAPSDSNGSSPPSDEDLQIPTIEVPGDPTKGAGVNRPRATPDVRPARIVLNRSLTGSVNKGPAHRSQGISVVFEPRDSGGQYVPAMGDVSVVVLDPTQRGAAARVARWDFTADEAAGHLRKTALGRGYHFDLPWPSQPPESGKLQLFVRLMTPGGQKLVTQMPLGISGPGPARQSSAVEHATASSAAASDWTKLSAATRSALAEQRAAEFMQEASVESASRPSRDHAQAASEVPANREESSHDDAEAQVNSTERALVDQWPPSRQSSSRPVVERAVWSPER